VPNPTEASQQLVAVDVAAPDRDLATPPAKHATSLTRMESPRSTVPHRRLCGRDRDGHRGARVPVIEGIGALVDATTQGPYRPCGA
jgi:hypothetical protein